MTTYNVYYSREGMFSAFISGDRLPRIRTLDNTHAFIKSVEFDAARDAPNTELTLERVYWAMQAEEWSPNGEANELIRASGAGHTSMSVGDVIGQCNSRNPWIAARYWVITATGFKELEA